MKFGGREKLVMIVGGVAVALLLLYRFGLSPALERLRMLDRLVATKERDLHQMKTLRETYLAQKRLMEDVNRSLAQRGQDFAIFSFLEDLANKAGMKDNIIYMKPALTSSGELFRESSVEMRLEGIALQQLTRYLYDIERAPQLLRVRRMHIKPRAANPDLLDVTFQVSTFYLQERTSSLQGLYGVDRSCIAGKHRSTGLCPPHRSSQPVTMRYTRHAKSAGKEPCHRRDRALVVADTHRRRGMA